MRSNRTTCNIARAREILGAKSDAAVYQMVARWQVPYRKLGRRLAFFEDELVDFIDQCPGVRPDEAAQARECNR